MGTGYHLLDNPNVYANDSGDGNFRFHGFLVSKQPKRVVVVHTAEVAPTVSSAEQVAKYLARTDRAASYQSVFDSDGEVRLLPSNAVAYGVRGFNSPAIHHSAATRASSWGAQPSWDAATVAHMAAALARDAAEHSITLQRITASQARAGASGVVSHAEMDPSRRSDPGRGFPWAQYLAAARGGVAPAPRDLTRGMRGGDVLDWQHALLSEDPRALPRFGADGDFGGESEAATKAVQGRVGLERTGVVDAATRAAMAELLDPPVGPDTARHAVAVLEVPADAALHDRRAAAALAVGLGAPRVGPADDVHVDQLLVVGGPALRSLRTRSRYRQVVELAGPDRLRTWRAAADYLANHPPGL